MHEVRILRVRREMGILRGLPSLAKSAKAKAEAKEEKQEEGATMTTLRDILAEARARDGGAEAEAMAFNERVCQHLAWCIEHDLVSHDRAREVLGVSVMTFRECVREWIEQGWMTPKEQPL